jgi:hypothetical protein
MASPTKTVPGAAPDAGNDPGSRQPTEAGLTPGQVRTARKMLIEGATFEDVILTFLARGQRVAQHEVENYFRSNPRLHALRASHAVEVARRIRKETKEGDPEDVELADAVIMTGLLRLNRSTAMLDVNDALRRRYERENVHLKQKVLRLQEKATLVNTEVARARKRMLSVQWKSARHKLREMQEELARGKKNEITGPQLAARIQEIYGLVEAPPVAPVGAPASQYE